MHWADHTKRFSLTRHRKDFLNEVKQKSMTQNRIIPELTQVLLDTKLWSIDTRRSFMWHDGTDHLYSQMKGYSVGRYRLEITKLLRKYKGFLYKIKIYYTPYDPQCLKREGRFNTYKELLELLGSVNKDLIDENRKWELK